MMWNIENKDEIFDGRRDLPSVFLAIENPKAMNLVLAVENILKWKGSLW